MPFGQTQVSKGGFFGESNLARQNFGFFSPWRPQKGCEPRHDETQNKKSLDKVSETIPTLKESLLSVGDETQKPKSI